MKVKREKEFTQSCLTLSDPMDCHLPGSSVHGIFQARVLEWGAIAFSREGAKTSLYWVWIQTVPAGSVKTLASVHEAGDMEDVPTTSLPDNQAKEAGKLNPHAVYSRAIT